MVRSFMSSSFDKYFNTDIGKTFLITTILALVFGFLSIAIPIAPANENAWYSFLYMDVTLPPDQRMNWGLVILEAFVFTFFYFFSTVALGSYAEIQNRLPSWGEVTFAALITILLSYFFPKVSVGDVNVTGGSGYNHFTPKMQLAVFILTLVGITLSTLYLVYSEPKSE